MYVRGKGNIQDCVAEGCHGGIVVDFLGKATISGTNVRRNAFSGVLVLGEARITDSSVTGNAQNGVIACKQDEECKAICTVTENVECRGNRTSNRPVDADYRAFQGCAFRGCRTTSCCSTAQEHTTHVK